MGDSSGLGNPKPCLVGRHVLGATARRGPASAALNRQGQRRPEIPAHAGLVHGEVWRHCCRTADRERVSPLGNKWGNRLVAVDWLHCLSHRFDHGWVPVMP